MMVNRTLLLVFAVVLACCATTALGESRIRRGAASGALSLRMNKRRSVSGAVCVSTCAVRPTLSHPEVALLANVTTCVVDPSLSGHFCPVCIGPKIDGLCQGKCVDFCSPERVARGFFDDVGDFFEDVADDVTDTFQDAFGDVADFFSDVTDEVINAIQEQFEALPGHIQQLVDGTVAFAEATLADLDQIGQDILGHLKAVADLTITQLRHLSERLVSFTLDNLQGFLNQLPLDLFRETLADFGCERRWQPSQASIFFDKATTAIGSVTGWDVDHFRELGSLIIGVASGDVSKIDDLVFKSAVLIISGYTGVPPDVVEAFAERAVEVIGVVATWDSSDWRAVGQVAIGLTEGDFEQLRDSEQLNELTRVAVGLDIRQIEAIATTGIRLIGGISSNDERAWQELATFAAGIAADELYDIGLVGIEAIGRVPWLELDEAQLTALWNRTTTLLGQPDQWSGDQWAQVGHSALAIGVDAIENLGEEGIEALGKFGVDTTQASALLGRFVQLAGDPSSWSEEQWKKLGESAIAVTTDMIATLDEKTLRAFLNATGRLLDPQLRAALDQAKTLHKHPISDWKASDFEVLGRAVLALSPPEIASIGEQALVYLAKVDITSAEQLVALAQRAEQLFGEIHTWDASTWQELGHLASTVVAQHADILTQDSFEAFASGSIEQWTLASLQTISPRLVSLFGTLDKMTVEDLQRLGPVIKAVTSNDIQRLTDVAIPFLRDALPDFTELTQFTSITDVADATLGAQCSRSLPSCSDLSFVSIEAADLCEEQSESIGRRLRELGGEVSQWLEEDFELVGGLVRTLAPADMGQLSLTQLETVIEAGCHRLEVVECIVKGATKLLANGNGVGSWSFDDLRMLADNVIGMDADALSALSQTTLSEGLSFLGAQTEWNVAQLNTLADQALQFLAEPRKWRKSTVTELGTILAGVPDSNLTDIPASALAGASYQTAAAMCNAQKLHTLTESQLKSLAHATQITCPQEAHLFTSAQSSIVAAESTGKSGRGGRIAAGILIPVAIVILIVGVWYYRKNTPRGNVARRVQAINRLQESSA
eukprot:m.353385 g.353385  ORF g.353385 m.353385 type:complete len:1058 (-) comp16759_c0_seq1:379-3552(-)